MDRESKTGGEKTNQVRERKQEKGTMLCEHTGQNKVGNGEQRSKNQNGKIPKQ